MVSASSLLFPVIVPMLSDMTFNLTSDNSDVFYKQNTRFYNLHSDPYKYVPFSYIHYKSDVSHLCVFFRAL